MEKRRHFRISDFLRIELYERSRRLFPHTGPGEQAIVTARHGDILDAVVEALRRIRESGNLDARTFRHILAECLSGCYTNVEYEDDPKHPAPERRPVSLSEGGLCVELPPGCLNEPGHFLQVTLYLEDGGAPLQLSGARVSLENTRTATRLRLRFLNLSEPDRRRLFRYILRQQARRIRVASTTPAQRI